MSVFLNKVVSLLSTSVMTFHSGGVVTTKDLSDDEEDDTETERGDVDVGVKTPPGQPRFARAARRSRKVAVGVEAIGLIARLSSDDAGRHALITHVPGGVLSALVPCLRSDWGQTSAFAARAVAVRCRTALHRIQRLTF